jgi:hypothetical protein
MTGAGLLLLTVLSTAPENNGSAFDEDRFGIELFGQAAVTRTGWTFSGSGPGFAAGIRLRFGPSLGIGVAVESAAGGSADPGRPWTLHRQQIAFDVQWRFDTGPHIRPWVSLGMAFGKADLDEDDGPHISSAHAVDWARLGLGVDFLIGRNLALGPLVRGSLGRTALASPEDIASTPQPDTHRALNTFELGVRTLVGF